MGLPSLVWFVACTSVFAMEPEKDVYQVAVEEFLEAPADVQLEVVEEITRRIESTVHSELRKLLDLRDQARRDVEIQAAVSRQYHDPAIYAPGRVTRRFADPESSQVRRVAERFRPYNNMPSFLRSVRYDFGENELFFEERQLTPEDRLYNFLEGNIPEVDLLVAWLQKQFDHRKDLDDLARHFQHVYCSLEGECYEDVTIYDAFASEESMDMPDVDTIPFAIHIKRDKSFKSPIPATSKRKRLYSSIKKDFLKFYQHRSFVEEASHLFVNPHDWVREDHEGVRPNLLYVIASKEEDVEELGSYFRKLKDRERFMRDSKILVRRDRDWKQDIQQFTDRRIEARWEVAGSAYDVLRDYGYLRGEEEQDGP